jgi:(E)-4-hydroxy-3-methylbut-2-enyl-diphosphate synthase
MLAKIDRNPTRAVRIGTAAIGGGNPVLVQSMCATKTVDIDATVEQVHLLARAGAGIVRVAVDTAADAAALVEIRDRTDANLSVDLQENYRLAAQVSPLVDKIRYNPGHLHHHEPEHPWQDKVRFLADTARAADCAIRVGVNCGSVDPAISRRFEPGDSIGPMLASALEHCDFLDSIGFRRYCVSLKDSGPIKVIDSNRRFARQRPDVPLHLGVTEAGMPPEGILKTRVALERLLAEGIGDTIRVSLTVPNSQKHEEVEAGRQILADVAGGNFLSESEISRATAGDRLNIISCPSCSRVQNGSFVELAQKIREMTVYAAAYPITIAVMGCRVNGPGETDDADLGVWCGATRVNLKRGGRKVGSFGYDEILERLREELDKLVQIQNDRVKP